jgi:hypothetical protein
VEDMHPRDFFYTSLYENVSWDSFTGTEHRWDRVHVAMPNDGGDWEQMDAGACNMNICDPQVRQIDWGVERKSFFKFRRSYKTRIICLDQIRHVEEAANQLEAIWKGLAKVPEYIIADWMKFQMVQGANLIYICDSTVAPFLPTPSTFTSGLNTINLGSSANLPGSKLQMPFLMRQVEPLMLQGYFDGSFTPAGTFKVVTDIQSQYELCQGNPALSAMYDAADFEKGGKFYKYGVMAGCGNFLFAIHPYLPRFNHVGNGVLQRVWPYQNLGTTVGLSPTVDAQYANATYQISGIVHRKARTVYVGEIPSIHPRMQFGSRDLFGKWSWINDAYLEGFDPNTGVVCKVENPRRNKGYFLADFEAGVQNTRPELEAMILHKREPQGIVNLPRAATDVVWGSAGVMGGTGQYQSLLPYNAFCDPQGEEL